MMSWTGIFFIYDIMLIFKPQFKKVHDVPLLMISLIIEQTILSKLWYFTADCTLLQLPGNSMLDLKGHICDFFFISANMWTHNIVNKQDTKAQVSLMLNSRLFCTLVLFRGHRFCKLQIIDVLVHLLPQIGDMSPGCRLRAELPKGGIRGIKEEFREKIPYPNWQTDQLMPCNCCMWPCYLKRLYKP